jgi:hypothetical protein
MGADRSRSIFASRANAERRHPIFEQPCTILKASIPSEQLQLLLNRLLDRVGLLLGQSTDT